MIKVIIPTHLFKELSDKIIEDICMLSLGQKKFEKEEEKRGKNTGQYIKLIKDDSLKYVCFSRDSCSQSRNSFILQNFPSAYQHFLEDETKMEKEFEYYIRDFSKPHPAFVIYSYKLLLTAGIRILNLEKVVPSEKVGYLDHRTPFRDYKQMRKYRLESSGKNKSNIPTIFEENEDEIAVYGKTYGANGRETTVICLALKSLVEKKIRVYNVNETSELHPASIDTANKVILSFYDIEIDKSAMDLEPADKDEKAKRKTRLYHINLLKKFHDKKCYLCDCDIENLMIGSHIHRVTDIEKSSLDEKKKQEEMIDGDNGFWLCANHDKLFEYGHIYFEGNKMAISKKLQDKQIDYVKKITTNYKCDKVTKSKSSDDTDTEEIGFTIKTEDYNEKMKYYLELHKKRVLKK